MTDRGPEHRLTFLGNLSPQVLRQSPEREEGHPLCPEAGWAGASQRAQRAPRGCMPGTDRTSLWNQQTTRQLLKFQMGEGLSGFQAPQTRLFWHGDLPEPFFRPSRGEGWPTPPTRDTEAWHEGRDLVAAGRA